jgi:ABC-type nitrate/sulfonate/bicarbonate transport system ATPase subunit
VTPEANPAPGAPDTVLAARRLSKTFRVDGRLTPALRDVSLEARPGEFLTLIGPSGCGKSTLLAILCGLLQPDEGEVLLHGRPASGLLGRVGYMPQRDLLLPWRRVLDNILLGPQIMGRDLRAEREEARGALARFGLEKFAGDYPATLSGGMRQRVALLRTFLCRQEITLLDEPLGALDALTRLQLRQWLLEVWSRYRQTVVFVTHDVEEAVFMSDRVYVLSPRPATVAAEVAIELPRPRTRELLAAPRFIAYRQELLGALGL